MKKILGFFGIILLLSSCGKENEFTTDFGSVLVINASPSAATPTTNMNVYIDTLIKTGTPLAYRANSGYLAAVPGQRTIQARPSGNSAINYVNLTNQQVDFNSASTIVVYDTTTVNSNALLSVRLTDDLSFPVSGQVKVRFLHLAANAPTVDVTLLRTSATTLDSVTLTSVSYIGTTPNQAKLSAFTGVPSGIYTIRVKLAGTQTVALQSANVNLSGLNGIYTLYAAGTAVGAPLTNNVIRHF
jgi:Domain of unknown function (DUF4397)